MPSYIGLGLKIVSRFMELGFPMGLNLSKNKRTPPGGVLLRESLFYTEGFTIGALALSGILLVGTHGNLIQGAEILALAMMHTLGYGTTNTFVGLHVFSPPKIHS